MVYYFVHLFWSYSLIEILAEKLENLEGMQFVYV